MDKKEFDFLTAKARQLRDDAIETLMYFGSGHIGGVMSVMDALTVIYYSKAKNLDPKDPKNPNRDKVIMSKGHAGPAMYVTLADKGYFDKEELKTLNKLHTNLPSHCDRTKTPGIDMTAGSLGQGLSAACGMAIASKIDGIDNTIYCFLGDGESQEGQVWEASMFAAAQKLDNLIVLLDNNKMQLDGPTATINDLAPAADKWKSFGFFVQDIDGHDIAAIGDAIDACKAQKGKPSMIVLNTKKGKGFSYAEAASNCHNMAITEEMYKTETAGRR